MVSSRFDTRRHLDERRTSSPYLVSLGASARQRTTKRTSDILEGTAGWRFGESVIGMGASHQSPPVKETEEERMAREWAELAEETEETDDQRLAIEWGMLSAFPNEIQVNSLDELSELIVKFHKFRYFKTYPKFEGQIILESIIFKAWSLGVLHTFLSFEGLHYASWSVRFSRCVFGTKVGLPSEMRSCIIDLRGMDFSNMSLRGEDLSNADLRGANLAGTDLSNAKLVKADLWGANLKGTNLNDANIFGVNMKGVLGLSRAEEKNLRKRAKTISM